MLDNLFFCQVAKFRRVKLTSLTSATKMVKHFYSGLEVLFTRKPLSACKKVLVTQKGLLKSKTNPRKNGLSPSWVVLPMAILVLIVAKRYNWVSNGRVKFVFLRSCQVLGCFWQQQKMLQFLPFCAFWGNVSFCLAINHLDSFLSP